MRVRSLIGLGLLALQGGAIVYARFTPARYFCWAPHDSQSEYQIEATVSGEHLKDDSIALRYQLPAKGVEARSIELVLDVVRQYEETRGQKENARVVVHYRVNDGEAREWHWPAP
jgi:hypothetical protein